MGKEVLENIDIFENAKKYWLDKLSNSLSEIKLSTIVKEDDKHIYDSYSFAFTSEISSRVFGLTKNNDISVYVLLLTAFKLLLYRYTNENNINIVSPTLKSSNQNYNKLIILHDILNDNLTFRELLMQVKQTAADGYKNQFYPIGKILKHLGVENGTELFNIMFLYKSIHKNEAITHSEEELNCNLVFAIDKIENQLVGEISFDTQYYTSHEISNLVGFYQLILEQTLENINISIKDIELVSPEEKRRLLYEFNKEDIELGEVETINQLFGQQVLSTPNNIALTCMLYDNDKPCCENLTFSELNSKANQLASYLIKNGIKENDLVGVITSSPIAIAVSILGILKAGGAYLPIDPAYPEERINYTIQDSNVGFLITDSEINDVLEHKQNIVTINYDNIDLSSESTENPKRKVEASNLAYVIYTSGSTGRPKGTMLQHGNIVNTLLFRKNEYKFDYSDVSIQLFSYAFDGFVTSFFTPLISGIRNVLLDNKGMRDINCIREAIIENKVTHFISVPALYETIVNSLNSEELKSLKIVVLAGDKVSHSIIAETNKKNCNIEIAIEYGVTECAVLSTINRNQQQGESIKIGVPISNTKVYVLDNFNRLQPIGIPGELCISGIGVSNIGYINKEELTKDRFISNPFNENKILYKTGDIARWTADGKLEFLGRRDHQIKLRGFRIELGEIENCLREHKGIKEAVVVIQGIKGDKGNRKEEKYICAYYVTKEQVELEESDIRQHMHNSLPQYMVPSFFIKMDFLPTTPNGKLDIYKMPMPEIIEKEIYIAPRDEIENTLAGIWADILTIEKEQIGIDSSFFAFGGHSLKLASMVSKIYKKLNVKISIAKIFDNLTIRQLSKYIKENTKTEYVPIEKAPEQEYYELSSAQRRLYFLQQMDKTSTAYNISTVMNVEGELNKDRLQNALNQLIDRHEILRTSFHLIENEYVQKIHKNISFEIQYKELINVENKLIQESITAFMHSFDLGYAPLFRIGILKINSNKHLLLIDMHHIISDGVSMDIFIKEFMDIYNHKELPELNIQFKDYCIWQGKQLNELKLQEKYWLEQFKDDIPVLNLPTDYERPVTSDFKGNKINFELSSEQSTELKKIALTEGTTLYMVLLSTYYIFLNKITGQSDIVVGTPVAARDHDDLSNIIGMLVNTLCLRNYVEAEDTFIQLLKNIKGNTLQAFENQNYPYENLVDAVKINRATNRNPLFDTMFMLQNMDMASLEIQGLQLSPYKYERNISKFDLTLQCIEVGDKLEFEFEYSTSIFKTSTVELFINYFKTLVKEIVLNKNNKIKDLTLLTHDEINYLLKDFNNTTSEVTNTKTVYEMFEEQAIKCPDSTAVIFENESLTYRQLSEKSNKLASYITSMLKGRQAVIGLVTKPSIETIISILAILKAGCSYVPIDMSYPNIRNKYIIKDSKVSLILTQDNLLDVCRELSEDSLTENIIDIENKNIYSRDDVNSINRPTEKNIEDTAYIIYTSGSTGNPKGVMVKHMGLSNYIFWAAKNYVRGENINFPLYTSLAFDLTVTSIFTPLITGNAIIIYDEQSDSTFITKILADHRIGAVKLTPSHLKIIRDSRIESCGVKRLILGGENLTVELSKEVLSTLGTHIEIYNEYGPTEGTVGCMIHKFDPNIDIGNSVPIGVPIDNTKIYVLDKYQKPVPPKVTGEIYISGHGVAKGYLGKEKLTAESFIPNPFNDHSIMYRTGDLGRFSDVDCIEFLGRADQQIKLRGYRVELCEIENCLLKHDYIKEAVIIPERGQASDKEDISNLIAYYTGDSEISTSELRRYLADKLPDYMIPAYFIFLEVIPLTHNKKIDINALPKPDRSRPKLETSYIEPKNAIEKKIADIWSRVLKKDRIGIDDSFFDLGGNSLDLLKVNNKLKEVFNKEIEVAKMFSFPTVAHLAKYINQGEDNIDIYDDEIDMAANIREQTILNFLGDIDE